MGEANDSYGALGPLELVDRVIRPAMLKQEVVPGTSLNLETYGNLSYERSGDQLGGATGSPLWLRASRIALSASLYSERLRVVAFNAMPLISARGYGHRGNLHWALGCETCLMAALGRRYGELERAALAADGWVHEARCETGSKPLWNGWKHMETAFKQPRKALNLDLLGPI